MDGGPRAAQLPGMASDGPRGPPTPTSAPDGGPRASPLPAMASRSPRGQLSSPSELAPHNAGPEPDVELHGGASEASPAPPRPSGGPGQGSGGGRLRSPPFTKNEKLRLAHVFCDGDVASGVAVSRGTMTRPQKDARTSRLAVWVVLVADIFNSNKEFVIPDACADGGIDPNMHPYERTGELLKAKWAEVRTPALLRDYSSVLARKGVGGGHVCSGGDFSDLCSHQRWRSVPLV